MHVDHPFPNSEANTMFVLFRASIAANFKNVGLQCSKQWFGDVTMHVPGPPVLINRGVFNLSVCVITVFASFATNHCVLLTRSFGVFTFAFFKVRFAKHVLAWVCPSTADKFFEFVLSARDFPTSF